MTSLSLEHPYTLAIDIGGTGLKANVLDCDGEMVADRVEVPTTYPMPPERLVEKLTGLARTSCPKPTASPPASPGWSAWAAS